LAESSYEHETGTPVVSRIISRTAFSCDGFLVANWPAMANPVTLSIFNNSAFKVLKSSLESSFPQ
jgi:hypothetical protein